MGKQYFLSVYSHSEEAVAPPPLSCTVHLVSSGDLHILEHNSGTQRIFVYSCTCLSVTLADVSILGRNEATFLHSSVHMRSSLNPANEIHE